MFKNGAQNCIEIEARGERTRQLVKNKQVCERDAVFRLVRHFSWPECGGRLRCILSHPALARKHAGQIPGAFALP
jgi:hypothetical protein